MVLENFNGVDFLLRFIVISLLLLTLVFHWGSQEINQPLSIEEPTLYTVKKGASVSSITLDLVERGWLENRFWLRNYTRFRAELKNIKAGTYMVTPDLSGLGLIQLLNTGREHQFQITFIEGTTFKQWLEQLAQQASLIHDVSSLDGMAQQAALISLPKQLKKTHLEGLFFPDTYAFTYGTKESTILKRAAKRMDKVLTESWNNRVQNLPYKTPYEALIMASIIEKETGRLEEQPVIASVFVNRLNKKMRLQTDPTVIYGLGDAYQGDITFAHLRQKTAYNTYRIDGLPPTPIAMPGQSAIVNSLHPEHTDYLYFVSKGNGEHQFSTNLKDHNKAVKDYQLKKK